MDLVTIITPSYNSSPFISDTINSVINQTYQNWEMIIVDDASKDDSVNKILSLTKDDKRINLISLPNNVGAANARNIALRKAKGRFIAFLDSDDIWYNNKLEKQLKFMLKNDYGFTFSSYETLLEDGTNTGHIIQVPKNINYYQYLKNTIIGCLTVVIDKEKIGYFEMPDIKSSHDMALWLIILKKGNIAHGLNEVLAKYRLVSTSNTKSKWKASKDVWKVYRNLEKLNLFLSSWYFINYAMNAVIKRI